MKTHDDGKAGWAPCDDVGETPKEEIVNDKDGISVEAAAKTAEGSGAHPQCEAALGSLVQVCLGRVSELRSIAVWFHFLECFEARAWRFEDKILESARMRICACMLGLCARASAARAHVICAPAGHGVHTHAHPVLSGPFG